MSHTICAHKIEGQLCTSKRCTDPHVIVICRPRSAEGPGPGRLGFGLGGNLNGEVEGRVGGYIDNIIIL